VDALNYKFKYSQRQAPSSIETRLSLEALRAKFPGVSRFACTPVIATGPRSLRKWVAKLNLFFLKQFDWCISVVHKFHGSLSVNSRFPRD
jgi:hypothetical protein